MYHLVSLLLYLLGIYPSIYNVDWMLFCCECWMQHEVQGQIQHNVSSSVPMVFIWLKLQDFMLFLPEQKIRFWILPPFVCERIENPGACISVLFPFWMPDIETKQKFHCRQPQVLIPSAMRSSTWQMSGPGSSMVRLAAGSPTCNRKAWISCQGSRGRRSEECHSGLTDSNKGSCHMNSKATVKLGQDHKQSLQEAQQVGELVAATDWNFHTYFK